jgi:hypothetical protein
VIANLLAWFIDRLREQSTWKGLVYLATALGIKLSPDIVPDRRGTILALCLILVGAINVARNERGAVQKVIDQNTVKPAEPSKPNP